MKVMCKLFLLTLFLIQPLCIQTVWKQIATSPFAIKAEPCGSDVSSGPYQVSYSPNGSFLTVANACDSLGSNIESGSVSVFSADQKSGVLTELSNSPFTTETIDKTIGLSFSPSGSPTLAVANEAATIKLFSYNTQTGDLSNLRAVESGSCSFNSAVALDYSPNGQHLASVAQEPTLNVYQVNQANGDLTCQQDVTSSPVDFPSSIAYYPTSSNESYLVIANQGNSVNDVVIFTANPITGVISNPKGFNLRNGTEEILPSWIDFSPNGKFLAVAVVDGVEVRQFRAVGINAPTLLPLNSTTSFFPTPTSGVRSVAYSPNGRWLATANANETISIFCVDQATGALFNRQDVTVGHTGNLGTGDLTFSVAFSPDSKFLAVSNRDDNSISVLTNPSANCITCNTLLNLSNNSSCAECTNSVNL